MNLDIATAQGMAAAMGIAPANVTLLRDGYATTAGIEQALTQMAGQVVAEAPALVYFSGHGTSFPVPEAGATRTQALVTYAGGMLLGSRLIELLQQVSEKTDRLFVFVDSCCSGGLVRTRGVDPDIRARFSPRADSANCSAVANRIVADQPLA